MSEHLWLNGLWLVAGGGGSVATPAPVLYGLVVFSV